MDCWSCAKYRDRTAVPLLMVLFGRPLRSCVPAHSASFTAEWNERTEECDRRAASRPDDARERYDAHSRALPPLDMSDSSEFKIPSPSSGIEYCENAFGTRIVAELSLSSCCTYLGCCAGRRRRRAARMTPSCRTPRR